MAENQGVGDSDEDEEERDMRAAMRASLDDQRRAGRDGSGTGSGATHTSRMGRSFSSREPQSPHHGGIRQQSFMDSWERGRTPAIPRSTSQRQPSIQK